MNQNIVPWSISFVSLLFVILTFSRTGKRNDIQDREKEESKFDGIKESLLKANMKLDQVCATTNETRSDIKSLNKDLQNLDVRISVVERDLKTAFSLIEEMKK